MHLKKELKINNMNILKNYDCFLNEKFGDPEIGLKDNEVKKTTDFLNRLLSNYFVLFLKLWNFHWNVDGPKFTHTHNFFNDLYDKFFEDIDEISERIRSLGERPLGTLKSYLEKTELKEHDDNEPVPSADEMYGIILRDYEFIIRELRNYLSGNVDNGTTNFLEDILMKKEKEAWMIRSHLKKNDNI
jgi:starvation-inducible DNA-binding protein